LLAGERAFSFARQAALSKRKVDDIVNERESRLLTLTVKRALSLPV
jgi:hypothetical protein